MPPTRGCLVCDTLGEACTVCREALLRARVAELERQVGDAGARALEALAARYRQRLAAAQNSHSRNALGLLVLALEDAAVEARATPAAGPGGAA